MPVCGETDLRSGSNEEVPFEKGTEGWKSRFSHEKEIAIAGYYSVELKRYGILTEATASRHCGFLRITYPKNENAKIIFNFSRRIAGRADFEHIEIVSDTCIEGYIKCTPAGGGFGRGGGNISYTLYFVCELSLPAQNMKFFANEEFVRDDIKIFENEDAGLLVDFGSKLEKTVVLKCGISYTDLDGARNNLSSESCGFDFDEMQKKASEAWEDAFKIVDVDGEDETDLTLFYTCLYHTLLDPDIQRMRTADLN